MSHAEGGDPQDIAVASRKALKTGEIRELEVSRLAAGGRGLAREDGLAWFVAGGLPGDRVRAEVLRVRSSYVEGRVSEILRPAPTRRVPACPLQARCGGCPWMPLPGPEQGRWKRALVLDALTRIGRLETPPLEPVRVLSPGLHYRNRVELSLGRDAAGAAVLGFHAVVPADGCVDVDRCLLQHDAANAVLADARSFLLGHAAAAGEAWDADGGMRLVLRRSFATGRILIVLRETTRPFPVALELAKYLTDRHPRVRGVVRLRALPDRRGGGRVETLAGGACLEERVGGISFRLPAGTFVQTNAEAMDALVQLVLESAGSLQGKSVLDLYGGVGAFGLAAAGRGAATVEVCDADRDAVACGRDAARRARIPGVRFRHGDVRRFLDRTPQPRAELILANPPRAGLGKRVAAALARIAPRRIVIVSCDPATHARDLKVLAGAGYALRRCIPVDLFPQTAHVETISVVEPGGGR